MEKNTVTSFEWSSFADADKNFARSLRAVFVMAPREMSQARLVELVKTNLSRGNVVFGVADEAYVDGFEGQIQFKTTPAADLQKLAEKIEKSQLNNKLYFIKYPQKAIDEVVRALRPRKVVVVRGSYLYTFHNSSTYRLLCKRNIPFEYVSPFVDETEARNYEANTTLPLVNDSIHGDERALFAVVENVAKQSYDYSFQVGAVLADYSGVDYSVVDAASNEVVPFQTYALHFGNSREDNLVTPQSDSARYDTIHAEMNLLVRAMKTGGTFADKSLFINMLPCPSCARVLAKTGLKEVVYQREYSDGYAELLFEQCGIKTRKVEL